MSSLKTIREKKNFTQQQLANLVGVKRSTVAMWESGKNLPTALKISKLAQILNCTSDEILESFNTNH